MPQLTLKHAAVAAVMSAFPSTALLASPNCGGGNHLVSSCGLHVFGTVGIQQREFHRVSYSTARRWSGVEAANRRSIASRLKLRRDQLPEETLRQLDAADRRVKEVEEEYWKSLDSEELVIEQKCAGGRAKLQVGLLQEAVEDYKAAAALRRPGARTWPLGLALFYVGEYGEAADVLGGDIRGFENQFEESATDERVWQAAAKIRGARVAGATAEGLAEIASKLPPLESDEPSRLRRTVYELFRGRAPPEDVEGVAKSMASEGAIDNLGQVFLGNVFLGLWHDCHGNEGVAEEYIMEACRSTYAQPDDLWYHTPRIHAKARGWTLPE